MRLIKKGILLTFYVTMFLPGFSQNFGTSMYFTNEKRKNVIVPFRLINNLIVIPMRINNSGIMYFILDSGVRTPIIVELFADDSVIIKTQQTRKIQGLGDGSPIEVLYSTNNDFSILGIIHSNLNAFVLQDNIFGLSSKMGTKINGLIGYDIFSSFIVEIDYIHERLTLHNPDKYKHKERKRAAEIPFVIQNKKSYFKTKITQEDGSIIIVKLLIDTGSSMALWLSLNSNKDLKLPSKCTNEFLGRGLNGDIYGKQGRIKSLFMGKYELVNPTVAYPDSNSVMNAVQQDGRNGSLGAEVLRRFRVIINYHNKTLTLLPNQNFRDKFEYNLSGMEIIVPYLDLPVFVISKIKEGSPADIAGLKIGDQILFISHKKNTELKFSEINAILQSKPGRSIKIIVQREDQKIKTKLVLRKDL